MKLARIALSVIILVVLIGIVIWRIGFYTPQPVETTEDSQSKQIDKPQKDNEKKTDGSPESKTSEAKATPAAKDDQNGKKPDGDRKPDDKNKPDDKKTADANKPTEPEKPQDPNNPLEALNLKDVQMKDLIQKLAEWTGKVIIPSDDAMKQKITIYAPEKLPRSQALSHIYSALRAKGFIAEYTGNIIYLKPITQAKLGSVPMVPANQPLAGIEDKNQIVQKVFKLKNYNPAQMGNILLPMIGEYGYVSSDENTGNLLVIDTVDNLIRFEKIIAEFDIPESEQAVEEIFQIHYGDPSEIVQLLRKLLGETTDPGRGRDRGGDKGGEKKDSEKATSIVIESSRVPIKLIPESKRKWIIASASVEDMKQIAEWIKKLDRQETVESEYETIQIEYADVTEIANQIDRALQQMPGAEGVSPSILVRPLSQSRQIMLFGRQDLRDMVKKLIAEIDVPTGKFEQKTFTLKYADTEQIKKNIDDLYKDSDANQSPWSYYRSRYGQSDSADTVKVIAFATMQQVTVTASPENMRKIEVQITEWDIPLDINKVRPRIVTLHNSDPVKMAELLTKLFSEDSESDDSFRRYWYGYWDDDDEKKKIVGALYGQLTFEDVPGTKKIIIISKIPEAYDVVEDLVKELDKQEMAEVPKVVPLNYADPEDLAERLNAIFNESGTTATFRLSEQGLSDYSMDEQDTAKGKSDEEKTKPGEYKPWWTGQRRRTDEMPISNVVGRIRFIPDPRSKAILVLAPPEFMENIGAMIKELDIPGKQVRVKAIIVEIDHSDLTSLGMQLASDPSVFGTLNENSASALASLSLLETRGSFTISAGTNITGLIDFLVKTINAKVLNQQTLWTRDNEEADFFRGQEVAFNTDMSVSETGGRVTSGIEFKKVGMTLRVRPGITPEKNVGMNLNIVISQLAPEFINEQPVRSVMDTHTALIVKDGETIMLGGMLFQEDSKIERKLPLLGDIPLLGGLFRHNEIVKSNREILVFITPYVIDKDPDKMSPEIRLQLEEEQKKLKNVSKQLQGNIKD